MENKCNESIGLILTAIEKAISSFRFRVRFPASEITSAFRVTRLRTGVIPHAAEQFLGSLMRPKSALAECFSVMRAKNRRCREKAAELRIRGRDGRERRRKVLRARQAAPAAGLNCIN